MGFILLGSAASNIGALPHLPRFYFGNATGPVILVLGSILVPLTEEVLFRGIIQTALNGNATSIPKLRPLVGTLVAASMFAVSHAVGFAITHNSAAVIFDIVSAFAFGLINGIWYERTNDLRGCVLAHVAGNFLTNVP